MATVRTLKCFIFSLNAACFSIAGDSFDTQFPSNIYSPIASHNDCIEYERRGMDFTICLWRRFLPELSDLSLSDRNVIYQFSRPFCQAWKDSEPSNLHPDVEGSYCLENSLAPNPETSRTKDKHRAAICAKHHLTQIYWRAKALTKFAALDLSTDASAVIDREKQNILLAKLALESQYKDLLDPNIIFPSRRSRSTYWLRTPMIDNAIIMLLWWLGRT